MIDLGFLLCIVVFAMLTPKHTDYRHLNLLLVGKFCIFIGLQLSILGLIHLGYGLYDGPWIDISRMFLDLVFVYVFFNARGYYLSFLCVLMASFHLINAFVQVEVDFYRNVMIGFQCLQLMWAAWGAADGIIDRMHAYIARHSLNSHSNQRH